TFTKAFGKALLELWQQEQSSAAPPRLSLRQKVHLPVEMTDRELFSGLSLGDTWGDAELVQVWEYLYCNKHLVVPEAWKSTMAALNTQLLDS
ncbi:unnamed protein product, partial [Symbiodinium necroappetens]